MFNINLDKVVAAINRLAAAIEDATITLKKIHNMTSDKEKEKK